MHYAPSFKQRYRITLLNSVRILQVEFENFVIRNFNANYKLK